MQVLIKYILATALLPKLTNLLAILTGLKIIIYTEIWGEVSKQDNDGVVLIVQLSYMMPLSSLGVA